MRRSSPDPEQTKEPCRYGSIAEGCLQCGACATVCPSGLYGGIDCPDIMRLVALGEVDVATERSIWLCTTCRSCSERCPSKVGPAEVIALLREEAARLGNLPKHFREEARMYLQNGSCFPHTGLTRKIRGELGLEDATPSQEAVEEAREIARRTGLGRLDLG